MLKQKPFLVFLGLLLIPFAAFFFRNGFVGPDSYGHLLLVCQNNNIIGASGVYFMLFSILPCNIMALKALLFLCCVVSGYFIIRLAILFSKENGWRASYLIFLSSVTVLEFTKLENDQFAFPILFASLYFFYHGLTTGSRKSWALSFGLLIPAGLLWSGAYFFVLAYALTVSWMFLFVGPPLLYDVVSNPFSWRNILGNILRTNQIAEDMAFQFHVHFLANIGLLGAIMEPVLMPQAVFFFLLGVASAKFWILSLPFLTVGLVLLHEQFKSAHLNSILVIVSVLMVFALAQSVLLNPPTQAHWQAIDYAVELDQNIGNDWGLGYYVMYKGGTTSSYGSMYRQEPIEKKVAISEHDLNCNLLKKFNRVGVWQC